MFAFYISGHWERTEGSRFYRCDSISKVGKVPSKEGEKKIILQKAWDPRILFRSWIADQQKLALHDRTLKPFPQGWFASAIKNAAFTSSVVVGLQFKVQYTTLAQWMKLSRIT
ncbi:hypothetical protein J6590_018613 [Homalodisca vitripennis]|nr:hypothetical protein J6590_018613 [Homalodisca vitripennis]